MSFSTWRIRRHRPIEVEELAWIANQIAAIQIDSGQTDAAEHTLAQAEQLFPNYPYTIENLARVRCGRTERSRSCSTVDKGIASIDRDPHLLFELAKAQDAAGQVREARATLTEFEKLAIAPETPRTTQNWISSCCTREALNAPTALKLAQHEI